MAVIMSCASCRANFREELTSSPARSGDLDVSTVVPADVIGHQVLLSQPSYFPILNSSENYLSFAYDVKTRCTVGDTQLGSLSYLFYI